MKYQHRVISHMAQADMERELNTLSGQGWELLSFNHSAVYIPNVGIRITYVATLRMLVTESPYR